MSKYDTWGKVDLRNACKAAGIKYTNMTNQTMREALVEHYTTDAPVVESSAAVVALENDYSNFVESLPATTAEPVVTTPQPEVSEQRTDDAPTAQPAPEAPAAPAEKPKASPAPKAERNGVSKPTRGLTLDVWNACDALKAEGKETTFEALKEKLPNHNAATIRTQRQRHKTFHSA